VLHRSGRKDADGDGSVTALPVALARESDHDEKHGSDELSLQAERAGLIAGIIHDVSASLDDVGATAQLLAAKVRDTVGDACVVSLMSDDGEHLQRAGVAFPDGVDGSAVRAYDSLTTDLDAGWAKRVLRRGEHVFVRRVDARDLMADLDPGHREIVNQYPLGSLIIVPLTARGETFGSLSVARFTSSPAYTDDEFGLVRDMVEGAALAIDNARMYAARLDAMREVRQLQEITDVGLARLALHDLLDALLQRLVDAMDADVARIRLLHDDGSSLVVGATVGYDNDEDDVPIRVGQGFAGQVAQTRAPVILGNVTPDMLVSPVLRELGLRSLAGVPLLSGSRLVGVLHVGSVVADRFGDADVNLLQLAADRIAIAVERTQAEEAEREARGHERFLADFATSAEAPDFETTVELIPRLLVPEVADWCAVYVVDEAGATRVGLGHHDPAMLPALYELYWRYVVGDGGELPDDSVVGGRLFCYHDIEPAEFETLAEDERHAMLLRQLDPRSSMVVPLVSRGRAFGAITLVSTSRSNRRFDERNLSFAREIGQRASHALALAGEHAGRLATQEALRESEERFRVAFEDAPIGLALVDLDERHGRIVHVNKAFSNLTGYSEAELIAMTPADLTDPAERAEDVNALDRMIRGELPSHQREGPIRHAHGEQVWVHLTMRAVPDQNGNPQYAIVQMADVTARRAAEDRLVFQALHDPLTGLSNRRVLMDRLQHELDDLSRRTTAVGVFYLDLDRFKRVNDDLGHEAGDQLLVEVSRRIETVMRPPDTIARLGGDEFVVVCGGLVDETDGIGIAERLLESISKPVTLAGHAVVVSPSIGVAFTRSVDEDPVELLRRADTAMYRAKGRGRACYELFDESLRMQANARLEMESDLRDALEHGYFRLHYQPIINLERGHIVGVEALLRMQHPVRGLLGPDEFIDVAEDSGLIGAIGQWVLEEACRQQARWQKVLPEPLHMAVNVSGRQVAHPSLAGIVDSALEQAGVAPELLTLEMTETVFMDAVHSVIENLQALKDSGVRLGIDDFGTGYSSLTYLRNFPIDVVKVDRSFVADLDDRPQDQAIVSAVVELGHTLDLTTIAEGVETERQLELLRVLGCDLAQGFHFARPRPPDEITDLILAGPNW
jgi:diguanylate cyclase (GGDEF)-like protein/PAS domain S-box-containing protein